MRAPSIKCISEVLAGGVFAVVRVCLVEDDASVRSSIGFALEVDGHQVDLFPTAEAVLASGCGEHWDCVVIDYHLPDMDGIQLLARLRAAGVTANAIFITSNPTKSLVAQISKVGAFLVEKPLLRNALSEAIVATVRPAA